MNVLILIVVEDGLVLVLLVSVSGLGLRVLILIVVEDGLVLVVPSQYGNSVQCLNPYCSGRWSRTPDDGDFKGDYVDVLILIVVEDGLVQIWRNWYTAAD